jgi:hypothetical protein
MGKIRKMNFGGAYIEDIKRLQEVLLENGYDADLSMCEEIWSDFSNDRYSAQWIGMPDSDVALWDAVSEIIQVMYDEQTKEDK